jgi:hypothetical protein
MDLEHELPDGTISFPDLQPTQINTNAPNIPLSENIDDSI